jgi:hypothetical protein
MALQTKRIQFEELSIVALARPIECEGRIIAAGSTGTIVDISPSGTYLEIEFLQPFHCVATVRVEDLDDKIIYSPSKA